MKKYVCTACGYVYDPEQGYSDSRVKPGTFFEELPDDCVGGTKGHFSYF
ncbi:MAG: rubredoxin [Nitrospirae bacterium RBG_13_41_22]|nr:MAG: rubredoxin [Nitrospirae bacterium RBG_13_41_22]